MKTANIKFFIFLGLVLAVGGAIFMGNKQQNKTLKVAFPVRLKATAYEPTSISLDYEYIFLENVLSPLVEILADGSIEPGVAEKVDWVGDELKLSIRKSLKTYSGIPITADDVVFSLKRLLVLSGNTHGNFKDIVCPGVELKTVEDSCPGIRQEGGAVFLNAKGRKSFLLPMLGAIDFAIIPKASVDPKTLKITDFSETSGPYSVESDDGDGNILLRLNPHHYFAAANVAEKIALIPTNSKVKSDSINAFKNGLVDHLTTIDAAKADELIGFANSSSDIESHVTMKIRSLVVVFTERGQKELSAGERRFIGEKLRTAFSKIYEGVSGFEQRSEFFPSLGEGGLTAEQQERLTQVRTQDIAAPKIKFKLGLIKRGPLEDWANPINKELAQAECYIENNAPDLKKDLKYIDVPHAFVASTDTGFMEDISLISYSLNAGLLGLSKPERTKWLSEYMATDDKALRIHKLKSLHFKALAEPSIVPLMASPYAAIVKKPWKMELSELYANNQLWRIKLR
jgi:hypothetical protein